MKTISELMDCSNRVALITGGAGHIGYAIGQSLAELGATVILNDLNNEQCQEKAIKLTKETGARVGGMPADISDEKLVQKMVEDIVKIYGSLDIIVHSAALVGTSMLKGWVVPFEQQSVQAWEAAMKINLTAAFILTQKAYPFLKRTGKGSVILISSIYGMVGPDYSLYEGTKMGVPTAYSASKAGLIQLTHHLATLLAPSIRVNSISPGGIERNQPASFQEKYILKTPLSRMGTEEDIKGAIAYLASDLSSYVTGHNLIVDGGWTVW